MNINSWKFLLITISPYSFTDVNSLAPGRPRCHFKNAIFSLVLLIGIFTSFKDNALRWMPRDLTNDKPTLVQVMACCRQATSRYLSQCWPCSMSPYGVTRSQLKNISAVTVAKGHFSPARHKLGRPPGLNFCDASCCHYSPLLQSPGFYATLLSSKALASMPLSSPPKPWLLCHSPLLQSPDFYAALLSSKALASLPLSSPPNPWLLCHSPLFQSPGFLCHSPLLQSPGFSATLLSSKALASMPLSSPPKPWLLCHSPLLQTPGFSATLLSSKPLASLPLSSPPKPWLLCHSPLLQSPGFSAAFLSSKTLASLPSTSPPLFPYDLHLLYKVLLSTQDFSFCVTKLLLSHEQQSSLSLNGCLPSGLQTQSLTLTLYVLNF